MTGKRPGEASGSGAGPGSVAGFFEDYARDFDALYGTRRSLLNDLVNPILRRSMKLRTERTLAGCSPIEGATVLDVGCGPGHHSVELARRGAALDAEVIHRVEGRVGEHPAEIEEHRGNRHRRTLNGRHAGS